MKRTQQNLRPLSPRRLLVVTLYLTPPYPGMAAALRAAGYSEATALHHAHRIFRDSRVQRLLKHHNEESERRFLESLRRPETI